METVHAFPPEKKRRIGYIEGRDELFETKLLKLTEPEGASKHVLICSRDPGSAQALLPVVELLSKRPAYALTALLDGRAEEAFEGAFPDAEDMTPRDTALGLGTLQKPDLILSDVSSERGLERHATALFPDVPVVLVEDYHATANTYITELRERHLEDPTRICVADEAAKEILVRVFPDLAERVRVTGQPAFDRFAKEDTAGIRSETRTQLGLTDADTLVVYAGRPGMSDEEVTRTFVALGDAGSNFYFVFRKHPRDNRTDEEYENQIRMHGIRTLSVPGDMTMKVMGPAADVVMADWSVEGVHAAYRRIPALYVCDETLAKPPHVGMYPLPAVTLGASTAVSSVEAIASTLPPLLDKNSETVRALIENMERYYRADGRNAERVVEVIEDVRHDSEGS